MKRIPSKTYIKPKPYVFKRKTKEVITPQTKRKYFRR